MPHAKKTGPSSKKKSSSFWSFFSSLVPSGRQTFVHQPPLFGCSAAYKTWPPDTQRLPDPHVCTGWFLATFFTADTESHAVGHRGQGAPYCGLNEGKAESDRRGDAPKSCSSGISMGGRTLGEGGRAQELRNGSAGSRFVPPRPTVWGGTGGTRRLTLNSDVEKREKVILYHLGWSHRMAMGSAFGMPNTKDRILSRNTGPFNVLQSHLESG